MLYLCLADGFEEIEALAAIDILRRADIPVLTVGITGKTVSGAHKINVTADVLPDDVKNITGIILPGGMPGTKNLEKSDFVINTIKEVNKAGGLIAAICAAPSILGHLNLLNGKNATCFPGFEKDLFGANVTKSGVAVDGNIITANGPGAALEFGFAITDYITKSDNISAGIRQSMQCR